MQCRTWVSVPKHFLKIVLIFCGPSLFLKILLKMRLKTQEEMSYNPKERRFSCKADIKE